MPRAQKSRCCGLGIHNSPGVTVAISIAPKFADLQGNLLNTMAPTRVHSPSPVGPEKRLRPNSPAEDSTLYSCFAEDLLSNTNAMNLRTAYQESQPFKYCILDKLFDDTLLKNVKDECIDELSFSEKTTDIYRVSCMNSQINA